MRCISTFASLLALSTSVLAVPTKGTGFIAATSQEHERGGKEYIVLFNASAPTPPDVTEILNRIKLSPDDADVTHMFNNSVFGGFIAKMKSHCIDALNAMEDVAEVEAAVDMKVHVAQRLDYPWGLQRISSSQTVRGDPAARTFTYTFDDEKLGQGADIYILDTGIRDTHVAFGGRARQGFSFEANTTDGDGHGTHVAGTAAGDFFGVAPGANLIAVRILDANGAGRSTDGVRGIEYVIREHNRRKNEPGFVGSIMSMSFGFPNRSPSMDRVIQLASQAGIHVSVAAGNEAQDACISSPAANGGGNSDVVTVGAVDINDRIASFSNTGPCVDVYAPGVTITSSWTLGDKVINTISGTSMSCPHVTGLMAYLMAQNPGEFGQDPGALKRHIKETARQGVIRGTAIRGDPGLLISNGADGSALNARDVRRDLFADATGGIDWEVADGDFSAPMF